MLLDARTTAMYQICVESAEGCLLSSLLCSLLQVCLGKDPQRVEEGELKELKFAMLEELDVSRAQATHESDRARILADIEADHQGDVTHIKHIIIKHIIIKHITSNTPLVRWVLQVVLPDCVGVTSVQ